MEIHGKINKRANMQNYIKTYSLYKPKEGLFYWYAQMLWNNEKLCTEMLKIYRRTNRNGERVYYN